VLLVDDHPAVRQGLALLLSSEGIEVVANCACGKDALSRLGQDRPDLAIVDLSLDGEDGLTLVAALHRLDLPVLVYSMNCDSGAVGAAFAAGAFGYVAKREDHAVLVQAIGEVAARRRFVSAGAALALADSLAPASGEELPPLSGQEREVFRHLGKGERSSEIAASLQISVSTVESYFARLQQKLGLAGMHELRRKAIQYFQRRPV
jgi:DNA-binding NarL/FixJ family response regulator